MVGLLKYLKYDRQKNWIGQKKLDSTARESRVAPLSYRFHENQRKTTIVATITVTENKEGSVLHLDLLGCLDGRLRGIL